MERIVRGYCICSNFIEVFKSFSFTGVVPPPSAPTNRQERVIELFIARSKRTFYSNIYFRVSKVCFGSVSLSL